MCTFIPKSNSLVVSSETFWGNKLLVSGDWATVYPVGIQIGDKIYMASTSGVIDSLPNNLKVVVTHSGMWINNISQINTPLPIGNKTYYAFLYNLSYTITIYTHIKAGDTAYYRDMQHKIFTKEVFNVWSNLFAQPGDPAYGTPYHINFEGYSYPTNIYDPKYDLSTVGDLILGYTLSPEYEFQFGDLIEKTENGNYIYRDTWGGFIGVDVAKVIASGLVTNANVSTKVNNNKDVNGRTKNEINGVLNTQNNVQSYEDERYEHTEVHEEDIDNNNIESVNGDGYGFKAGGHKYWGGFIGFNYEHSLEAGDPLKKITHPEHKIFWGTGTELPLVVANTTISVPDSGRKFIENGTYDLSLMHYSLQNVYSTEYIDIGPRQEMYYIEPMYRFERVYRGPWDWGTASTSLIPRTTFKVGLAYLVKNYFVIRQYNVYVLYITTLDWQPSLLTEGRPQSPPDAYMGDIILDGLPTGAVEAGFTPWWATPEGMIMMIIIFIVIIVVVIVIIYIILKVVLKRFGGFKGGGQILGRVFKGAEETLKGGTKGTEKKEKGIKEKASIKRIAIKTAILFALILGGTYFIFTFLNLLMYYQYVLIIAAFGVGIYIYSKL